MTELTLAELEEGKRLELRRTVDFRFDDWCVRKGPALLAMARELIRIRSALEFLHGQSHEMFVVPSGALLGAAADLGWTDPVAVKASARQRREAWRCSYTGASGSEAGVQWYDDEKQRDAYLEVMPIKGNPVAVRYVEAELKGGEG